MGSIYPYLTRIIPALSLIVVVVLLVFSFIVAPYGKTERGEHHGEATKSQLVLGAYTIFLHVLSVIFPARVCWAMGDVIKGTKECVNIVDKPKRRKSQSMKNNKVSNVLRGPTFVIIIPAYKEEIETLQETIRVLASHPRARSSYHIYLAMEQREANSAVKARTLVDLFDSSFYNMSYTIHPSDIPGEAAGKSSNESWAAKQAFEEYKEYSKSNVIMTIMDADTHLSPRYFAQVSKHHHDNPGSSEETVYVPPMVFDRNLEHVPLPVRTADIMWAGAGLSNLYTYSSVCIPTSVYSLAMTLAERVGGWDTGPGAIGEDMHMYLKCFFALSGNLKVKIIYAAASQCNVSSNLQGFKGFIDGLQARYKQALRHMWGAMDTGYAIRQAIDMIWRRYQDSEPTFSQPANLEEIALWTRDLILTGLSAVCTLNWATPTPTLIKRKSLMPRSPPSASRINILNVLVLFHRLFEAHFLPLHLSLILATATLYDNLWGDLIPHSLSTALYFCSICRWIGWALIVIFFYRYDAYHRLCIELRREDMRACGMKKEAAGDENFSPRVFKVFGLLEAGIFPLGGFLFGAIPALQAVVSHVCTERITYHVSLKPQINMRCLTDRTESQPAQQNSRSVRARSDSWRKQAVSQFDHVASAMRYRPVKTEE